MRRTPESNPFREATFGALNVAISEAIRTLERRATLSRAEKLLFAKRLRFLLIAIAFRLRCGASTPGTPEMALDRSPHATVEGEFMPLYERTVREEIEGSRNYVLHRAADFVVGRRAEVWLLSENRIYRGSRDDEALRGILRELDAVRRREEY